MGKKPTKREQAYTLWVQEVPITQISARLGVARGTVQRWKKEDKWDELKESIPDPPKEAPAARPKLVSFERDRDGNRRQTAPVAAGPLPDLSTLEGQTTLIDRLIEYAVQQVADPASPNQYSSAMNAVPKLLSERRAIAPIDKTEFLLKLQDMFRDPGEILEYLKSNGWGRKAS